MVLLIGIAIIAISVLVYNVYNGRPKSVPEFSPY